MLCGRIHVAWQQNSRMRNEVQWSYTQTYRYYERDKKHSRYWIKRRNLYFKKKDFWVCTLHTFFYKKTLSFSEPRYSKKPIPKSGLKRGEIIQQVWLIFNVRTVVAVILAIYNKNKNIWVFGAEKGLRQNISSTHFFCKQLDFRFQPGVTNWFCQNEAKNCLIVL